MNNRQLETLVAVAEQRNFTRAARVLRVTQPAVSFQIRSLEEELGVCLLERQGKQIELTPAGDIVYQETKKIIAAQERIVEALASLASIETGRVVVGASTIPGEYILPRLVGGFKAIHPGVQLVVRLGDTEQVLQWLTAKDIDLAAVGARHPHPHLKYTHFLTDLLVAAIPEGHPLGGSDEGIELLELAGYPFVIRETGSGTRSAIETMLTQNGMDVGALDVAAEFSTTSGVLAAVAEGVGVSVVSRWAGNEARRTGRVIIRPIRGNEANRDLYLVENELRYRSPAARAFFEYVMAAAGGLAAGDGERL